jgi:hypothetical protein
MKALTLSILSLSLITNLYAIDCKNGYVSSIDSSRPLSDPEITEGYEYRDMTLQLEGKIDNKNYVINKNMELQEVNSKSKTTILKFSANFSGEDTVVSVFKHKGFHFFEVGMNDYMEGYLSSIYIVDLKNKKIVSHFTDRCGNHNEYLGLKKEVLTYMCGWHCKQNKYFTFDSKEGKFKKVIKKHNCKELPKTAQFDGLVQSHFKIRYMKDKNGIEYKSSKFPLTSKNCK